MMRGKSDLPFKVGDLVEARSFQIGFRGAWFRCKIRGITKKQGRVEHLLEYYDFPDEKLKTLRLYQVPPHPLVKTKEKHRELMLRPKYPPMYNEKQTPTHASEVTVIVDNSWKVGDLVDWSSDDCYWSGTITQLMGDDKAQIELKPPPVGEGSCYEVFLKDVRPSLDWSPEQGWTIPCQEGESGCPCARLMKPPVNQGVEAVSDASKNTETKKRSLEESSSTRVTKYKGFTQNSDTVEAAIMDLEEYINKVKWLKKVLDCGNETSSAKLEPEPPQWEFVHEIPKS